MDDLFDDFPPVASRYWGVLAVVVLLVLALWPAWALGAPPPAQPAAPTVADRLAAVLAHVEAGLKGATDFVAEQTPLLVREILLFERVRWTAWAAFLAGVALGLGRATRPAVSHYQAWAKRRGDAYRIEFKMCGEQECEWCANCGVYVVLALVRLAAMGLLVPAAYWAAMAWVAPRYYLLTMLAALR